MTAIANVSTALIGGVSKYPIAQTTIAAGGVGQAFTLPAPQQLAAWCLYNDSPGPLYVSEGTEQLGLGGIGVSGKVPGAQVGGYFQHDVPGGISQITIYAPTGITINRAPGVGGEAYLIIYTRN